MQSSVVLINDMCHKCGKSSNLEAVICGYCDNLYHFVCLEKINQYETSELVSIFFLRNFDVKWKCHQCVDHVCRVCKKISFQELCCRVCAQVYHFECVSKCTIIDISFLKKSNYSRLGWSCYVCQDLFNLLSQNDMNDVMLTFDELDFNQGYRYAHYLSVLDNFIRPHVFNKFIYSQFVHPYILNSPIFPRLEKPIDWCTFSKYISAAKLTMIPQKDILKKLTFKELLKARTVFNSKNAYLDLIYYQESVQYYISKIDKIYEMEIQIEQIDFLRDPHYLINRRFRKSNKYLQFGSILILFFFLIIIMVRFYKKWGILRNLNRNVQDLKVHNQLMKQIDIYKNPNKVIPIHRSKKLTRYTEQRNLRLHKTTYVIEKVKPTSKACQT
ncbi:hypothetical protein A3Q56_03148 [Intoshia linei]|uniref:Zinc finger PHD-type domain-containing protein n=1 Tax=Intoshia linei TaxID=1819745 RepID=A0A177B4G0_9BILA|nr:hypothetical protein A3Q56_03148 [Intoshia linei]